MPNINSSLLNIYHDTLYVDNFITLPEPIKGDFSNKIALFIDTPSNNDASINLLLNMMKACNISLDACQLYCITNPVEQSVALFNKLKPEKLICFGVPFTSEMMQLHIQKNAILEMGQCQILFTCNLLTLQNTPSEKTALWQSLQKLFELK